MITLLSIATSILVGWSVYAESVKGFMFAAFLIMIIGVLENEYTKKPSGRAR